MALYIKKLNRAIRYLKIGACKKNVNYGSKLKSEDVEKFRAFIRGKIWSKVFYFNCLNSVVRNELILQ